MADNLQVGKGLLILITKPADPLCILHSAYGQDLRLGNASTSTLKPLELISKKPYVEPLEIEVIPRKRDIQVIKVDASAGNDCYDPVSISRLVKYRMCV